MTSNSGWYYYTLPLCLSLYTMTHQTYLALTEPVTTQRGARRQPADPSTPRRTGSSRATVSRQQIVR